MTRLPLATDLKTRTGVPAGKDARLNNAYVETKGDQSVVRRRPSAQGGIAVGTGTAQGGIGFTIGSTPYFIGFWGDVLQTYTGSGTSWSSSVYYPRGTHITLDFADYWAANDNVNSQPTPSGSNANWSKNFVSYSYPRYTFSSTSFPTCGTGFPTVDALGACALTKITGIFAPYFYDGFDANFMYFHGTGGGGSGTIFYSYTKTPI